MTGNSLVDMAQETTVELTVQNIIIPGAAELVDSNNPNRFLAGAIFKLLDAERNVINECLVTDIKEKTFGGELLPGHYQFIETKAPSKYRLDHTPVYFLKNCSDLSATCLQAP